MALKIWRRGWLLLIAGQGACAMFGSSKPPCETLPVELFVKGSPMQNLNSEGQSMPVEIRAYFLKKREVFDRLDFGEIWRKGKDAIGPDALSEASFTVFPSEEKIVPVAAALDAQYLALIGLFRNLDGEQWKQVVDIHRLGERCQPDQLHAQIRAIVRDNRMVADDRID